MPLRDLHQNLRQFEAGVAGRFVCHAIQQFLNALTLRDPYRVQTLGNTLDQLVLALRFPRLQRQRAAFNAAFSSEHFPTHASAFLNEVLPLRRQIAHHPDALARYDRAVVDLMARFRFFRVRYFPTACHKVPSDDVSSHFLVAAQAYELLHGRPDLLERLLNDRPHGFHVQFCPQFAETFFDPGYMQINPITLWADTSRDRSPGVAHVLVHLLSQLETGAQTDVIFDMPPAHRERFLSLKRTMADHYWRQDGPFWGKLKALFWGENHVGIHPYAFLPENPEFLTITVEACQKTPQRLEKTDSGRDVAGFLKNYFKWACPEQF